MKRWFLITMIMAFLFATLAVQAEVINVNENQRVGNSNETTIEGLFGGNQANDQLIGCPGGVCPLPGSMMAPQSPPTRRIQRQPIQQQPPQQRQMIPPRSAQPPAQRYSQAPPPPLPQPGPPMAPRPGYVNPNLLKQRIVGDSPAVILRDLVHLVQDSQKRTRIMFIDPFQSKDGDLLVVSRPRVGGRAPAPIEANREATSFSSMQPAEQTAEQSGPAGKYVVLRGKDDDEIYAKMALFLNECLKNSMIAVISPQWSVKWGALVVGITPTRKNGQIVKVPADRSFVNPTRPAGPASPTSPNGPARSLLVSEPVPWPRIVLATVDEIEQ